MERSKKKEINTEVIKIYIVNEKQSIIVDDQETARELQGKILESNNLAWIIYTN